MPWPAGTTTSTASSRPGSAGLSRPGCLSDGGVRRWSLGSKYHTHAGEQGSCLRQHRCSKLILYGAACLRCRQTHYITDYAGAWQRKHCCRHKSCTVWASFLRSVACPAGAAAFRLIQQARLLGSPDPISSKVAPHSTAAETAGAQLYMPLARPPAVLAAGSAAAGLPARRLAANWRSPVHLDSLAQ